MSGSAIDRLRAECREQLQRVEPADLDVEIMAGALVVVCNEGYSSSHAG